jgi:DNA-binding GntR family transcriptional regulator
MELKNLGELERSNLAVDIAGLLRESIVKGEIPPGTRLIETEMARKLGVSRGPLREALRILETEDLLESYPGHGSFVPRISSRDIREVYSLRCILEEEAIRLAVENRKTEELNRLQETLNGMFEAANAGDTTKVTDLDYKFHQQIWVMADHTRLKNVLESITTRIRMYLAVQTQLYDDLAVGISDHELLVDALRTRDSEAGVQVIRNHLQVAAEVVLEYHKKHLTDET